MADTVLGQGNQAEQSQPRHSSLRNVPIPSFIDKSRDILRAKAHSFVFQVVGKSSQFPAFLKPPKRPPKRRFGQDGDFFLSELISQVAAHKLPSRGAGQALQRARREMCSMWPTASSHRPPHFFFFFFVNGVPLFPLGEAQRNLAGLTPRRAQSRPRGEHRPGKAPRPGQTEKRCAGLDLREARGDGGRRSAGGTRADTQTGGGPGGGSPAPPETPASRAGSRSLGGTDGGGAGGRPSGREGVMDSQCPPIASSRGRGAGQ